MKVRISVSSVILRSWELSDFMRNHIFTNKITSFSAAPESVISKAMNGKQI